MYLKLDEYLLRDFPSAEIGYLISEVNVANHDAYVEDLKVTLHEHIQKNGINQTNFAAHPSVSVWRNIYENSFHVKAKTYRSSIEALLRRIASGKEMWRINTIVDLYNCCSVLALLPMGGYDLDKISGDITVRYANEGEPFVALGTTAKIATKSNHIVYADAERVICWLWNHKDSADTCIDESTKKVVFFIDAFNHDPLKTAIDQLELHLSKLGCIQRGRGVLNRLNPIAHIS